MQVRYADGYRGERYQFSQTNATGATFDGNVEEVEGIGIEEGIKLIFERSAKNTFTRLAPDLLKHLANVYPELKPYHAQYKDGAKTLKGFCTWEKSPAELYEVLTNFFSCLTSWKAFFVFSNSVLNYTNALTKVVSLLRHLKMMTRPKGFDRFGFVGDVTDLIASVITLAENLVAWRREKEHLMHLHFNDHQFEVYEVEDNDGREVAARLQRGRTRVMSGMFDSHIYTLQRERCLNIGLTLNLMITCIFMSVMDVAQDLGKVGSSTYRLGDRWGRPVGIALIYIIGLIQPFVKKRIENLEKELKRVGYTYNTPRPWGDRPPTPRR